MTPRRKRLRAVAELAGVLGIAEPHTVAREHTATARSLIANRYEARAHATKHTEKARELEALALAHREVARITSAIGRRLR